MFVVAGLYVWYVIIMYVQVINTGREKRENMLKTMDKIGSIFEVQLEHENELLRNREKETPVTALLSYIKASLEVLDEAGQEDMCFEILCFVRNKKRIALKVVAIKKAICDALFDCKLIQN